MQSSRDEDAHISENDLQDQDGIPGPERDKLCDPPFSGRQTRLIFRLVNDAESVVHFRSQRHVSIML